MACPHLSSTANISAVIPTFCRALALRVTLEKILACKPSPSEVLVQIDAGDVETASMLEREFSRRVSWEQNREILGPGGGRDLLIRRARKPLVACFDDDSWPEDMDYFARAAQLALEFPQVAVLAASIRLRGSERKTEERRIRSMTCFENGGCVVRREAFLQIQGYLPLRYAYGMEEADVALQLRDRGWKILAAPELRVFHDADLGHHQSPAINAAHITNTALLAFLRYPVWLWPVGAGQVIRRVNYAIRAGRRAGILRGLADITAVCWRYRGYRRPVRASTVLRGKLGRV